MVVESTFLSITGMEMVTVVPSPSVLSMVRRPLCRAMISSATARPMPVPRRLLEPLMNFSLMRGRSLRGMPRPVSAMRMTT